MSRLVSVDDGAASSCLSSRLFPANISAPFLAFLLAHSVLEGGGPGSEGVGVNEVFVQRWIAPILFMLWLMGPFPQ